MSEKAKRLPDTDLGSLPSGYEWGELSYWKAGPIWRLNLPGAGVGSLESHDVVEHEDGTITVSPSILVEGSGSLLRRHGYLKRGVWEPCGDDCPGGEVSR